MCCPPPNGVATYSKASAIGYQDGAGAQAKFGDDAGWGLTFTSVNNSPLLVFNDMRNHLIRAVNPVTYVVSTLAGGGGIAPPGLNWQTNMFPVGQSGLRDGIGTNALFSGPVSTSGADRNGAMYVLDFYNNRIRRLDLTTKAVVTVAGGGPGGGTCKADGIGSNAAFQSLGFSTWVDPPRHVLYFRDWHQVLRLNLTDYNVTTLAGGGGATGAGFGNPCFTGWYSAFGKSLFANGVGTAALLSQPRGMVVHPNQPNLLYFSTSRVIATLELDTLRVRVWAGGGDYSHSEWPLNGPSQASAVGTNAIFGGDTALALDTLNNKLIMGGMGANAGGVGYIDIDTRLVFWMAGGSSTGNGIVQDGFGSFPTFSAANGITFWDMGGGGGMYFVFDSTYGLLRQIQSSAFGPTNTPTPSITPSHTPSPTSTPTFTPTPSPSPTYGSRTVTTLAGGGGDPSNAITHTGYADGIGTAATFSTPDTDPVASGVRGITYSSSVSGPAIYIADTFNSLVRKLDLSSLAVTTLAGSVYTVSRGSNPRCSAVKYVEGVGTNAKFCHTNAVEESGGVLYVADYWNDAIRSVDLATATVSTFIGGRAGGYGCNIDGTGTNARFQHPFAVSISNGLMFILDDNAVVRMVDMATKVVTSLAGGGGPQTPGASDSDGCHKTNQRVDGVGTNVIFNQPADLVADAQFVYVADYNSWTIRKVNILNGNTTTFAGGNAPGSGINKGGAQGSFHTPLSIAMDGFGNLDIVSGGQCLFALTLDSGAWVTLVAGKGYGSGQCVSGYNDGLVATAGFGGLSSVTVGPGAYYVMDYVGGTVRSIDGGSNLKVQTLTATPSQTPTLTPTMSPTPSVSPPPVVVRTVAGGGSSNAAYADGSGTTAWFNHPHGIALDSSSPPNLIIADNANNNVRKMTPGGIVTTLAGCVGQTCATWDGSGTNSKFWGPSGVAKRVESGADYFYVTDCYSCKVRKVSALGVVTTVLMSVSVQNSNTPSADGVGTNAYINCPNGAAVDSSGLLHVSGFFDSTIRRVTDPGASVSTFAGSSAGIGIFNGGVLLSGATYNFADGEGTNAKFYQPRGLAFDPSDNLYVADSKNNALRKISPLGIVTTLGPSTNTVASTLLLNGPQSVTYWQGQVYVGDTYRLRIVYPSGAVGALAGTFGDNGDIDGSGPSTASKVGYSWQGPMGLVVNPYDNLLYFADTSNNKIRTVSFIYPSITSTLTPSVTPTASATPSESPTASITPTATLTPTVTPSVSPSVSVTSTVSPTPSVTPSDTPTPSESPTATISPSPTSTVTV